MASRRVSSSSFPDMAGNIIRSMNRLADALSPYLRSAAHQPIHWHSWSPEAFAEARASDRPILLDIGAVWCHWCHVMDRETYEDPGIAELLDGRFTCIKVDRDERPDVDARYQRAVQALTGQGGWPLTVFLDPAGEAFFGGTYFPPDDRLGRPGFRTVLKSVLDAWHDRRPQVEAQALAVRRAITESSRDTGGAVTPAVLEEAEQRLFRIFDQAHGGFGSQPKFPHPAALLLLVDRWQSSGSPAARLMVTRTLSGMALGGIHDQIGGGFHRYSVDAEWVVPHFEKMSYDNSELLRAYVEGWAAFGEPLHRTTAQGIVRWVREVLADDRGGYAASQDADVGLEDDGDYFTWTRAEAAAEIAPEDFEAAAAVWDIGTAGEMHHAPDRNVLFVGESPEHFATRSGAQLDAVVASLSRAGDALRAARDARPSPFVDPTRYTGWNAMMASAMLRAGIVLGDEWAERQALATLGRIRHESKEADHVPHDPSGTVQGLLEDQLQCATAALDAFETTQEVEWLDWSLVLASRTWRDHEASDGALQDLARSGAGEGLLSAAIRPVDDAPTPSPNGVAALLALRLAAHTGDPVWRQRAERIIMVFGPESAGAPLHRATLLRAAAWLVHDPTHLVVTGARGSSGAAALHRAAVASSVPRKTIRWLSPDDPRIGLPEALIPLLDAAPADRPTAWCCTGTSCRAPIRRLEGWQKLLAELSSPGALNGQT
jgi:uncharacterized protein YyaL (SSP411 family)